MEDQKYLEEKFKRVYDKLDTIHVEVVRTNGRVNELEKKVQKQEDNMLEYKFLKKYPKLSVLSFVIILAWVGWEIVNKII